MIEQEIKKIQILELKKLLDMLNSWGNVLVNDNKLAQDRLQEIVDNIISQGHTIDEIDKLLK